MKNVHELNKVLNSDFTALYLIKTKKILKEEKKQNQTILQFTHFEKKPIYICGINHCLQILKNVKGNFHVYGVKEGSLVKPGHPILVISGDYSAVAEFESVIDGILARETSICNNVKTILTLIKPEQLIYMGDRADIYLTQPYDGYACWVAGMKIFTTKAHTELIPSKKDIKIVGTMPHALIQQYNGCLVTALKKYAKTFPNEKLSALIDYHNDIVNEIKSIPNNLKHKIASVRIDTSKNNCDKSLKKIPNNYGVSLNLVKLARKTLDANGMKHVKIIVSSGFNSQKIKNFIKQKAPVNFYGVGGSIVKINVNITCDLVCLNGKPQAKFGRKLAIKLNDLKKLNIYI